MTDALITSASIVERTLIPSTEAYTSPAPLVIVKE